MESKYRPVAQISLRSFVPWSATCWGCHPKPAFDRRSAPVLWRSRATKIRQHRPLRSRLTGRKSEVVSAIAAERHTRQNKNRYDKSRQENALTILLPLPYNNINVYERGKKHISLNPCAQMVFRNRAKIGLLFPSRTVNLFRHGPLPPGRIAFSGAIRFFLA
ncbi:MAG: hypothetical protein K2L38_10225 [Dysosmobacter sp.]|nr:hypothetical protein [Dysosmobacter sp.]